MDLNEQFKKAQDFLDERAAADKKLTALFVRIIRIASSLRCALDDATPDERGLHEALTATRGDLIELLRTEGVTHFGEQGETIDPERHCVKGTDGPPKDPPIVMHVVCEGLEWRSKVIHKSEVVASPGHSRKVAE